MRIGQDVSIQTCRDEGYMVMDYPVCEFVKDPTTTGCRFTRSLPDYARDGVIGEKIIVIDTWLNWEDLWGMYLDSKEGIDSMIGLEVLPTRCPDPHKLLELASNIDAYCGLV